MIPVSQIWLAAGDIHSSSLCHCLVVEQRVNSQPLDSQSHFTEESGETSYLPTVSLKALGWSHLLFREHHHPALARQQGVQ